MCLFTYQGEHKVYYKEIQEKRKKKTQIEANPAQVHSMYQMVPI